MIRANLTSLIVAFGVLFVYCSFLPTPQTEAAQCIKRVPDPKAYLKKQAAKYTDQAIETVLNANYGQVHYFEVISALVVGERAYACIAQKDYVKALEVMTLLGTKHLLKDALSHAGLGTILTVSSLAVVPIEVALQHGTRKTIQGALEYNIKVYSQYRDMEFTHDQIITGRGQGWKQVESENGWLRPLEPTTWGGSMPKAVPIQGITPADVYELAKLVYEGKQKFDADKLTVLTAVENEIKTAQASRPQFTFRLKDGSTKTGEIVELTIEVRSATGMVTVSGKDITSYRPGELRLKDGRVIKGQIVNPSLGVRSATGYFLVVLKDLEWFGVGSPAEQVAKTPQPAPRRRQEEARRRQEEERRPAKTAQATTPKPKPSTLHTIDTSDPDFTKYFDEIKRKVHSAWRYPPVKGRNTVSVRFHLERTGEIKNAQVVKSTDSKLNESALEAMSRAAPFAPVPEKFKALVGEPITLTFTVELPKWEAERIAREEAIRKAIEEQKRLAEEARRSPRETTRAKAGSKSSLVDEYIARNKVRWVNVDNETGVRFIAFQQRRAGWGDQIIVVGEVPRHIDLTDHHMAKNLLIKGKDHRIVNLTVEEYRRQADSPYEFYIPVDLYYHPVTEESIKSFLDPAYRQCTGCVYASFRGDIRDKPHHGYTRVRSSSGVYYYIHGFELLFYKNPLARMKETEERKRAAEERRRAAEANKRARIQVATAAAKSFITKYHVKEVVKVSQLRKNPFVYKRKQIAVFLIFTKMVSENAALFEGPFLFDEGHVLVTNVPSTLFKSGEYTLAVEVLGLTKGGLPYARYLGYQKGNLTKYIMMVLSKAEDRLVGKWRLLDKNWKETIEFFNNGSYRSRADYGGGTGKWRLVDEFHLALGERINKFRFQGGYLILVDSKGETYKYRRIK